MRQSTLVPAAFRMLSLPSGSSVGAEHLVAAPADDQELVAGEIGIDGHDVVAERPVEAGGRRGGLHVDLLVQVDGLVHDLGQRTGVHGVDESLHVHVEPSPVARAGRRCSADTDGCRESTPTGAGSGTSPAGCSRLRGRLQVRSGPGKRPGVAWWAGWALGQKFAAAGGKAGIGYRRQGDFGDRWIGIARREGVDDPSLPEIAHLTTDGERGRRSRGRARRRSG